MKLLLSLRKRGDGGGVHSGLGASELGSGADRQQRILLSEEAKSSTQSTWERKFTRKPCWQDFDATPCQQVELFTQDSVLQSLGVELADSTAAFFLGKQTVQHPQYVGSEDYQKAFLAGCRRHHLPAN